MGIETKVFRECGSELTDCLTDLFNLCLSTGSVPDEGKVAFLTPIYKGKGSKSKLDIYKPISILSPMLKSLKIYYPLKKVVFLNQISCLLLVILDLESIFHLKLP